MFFVDIINTMYSGPSIMAPKRSADTNFMSVRVTFDMLEHIPTITCHIEFGIQ